MRRELGLRKVLVISGFIRRLGVAVTKLLAADIINPPQPTHSPRQTGKGGTG